MILDFQLKWRIYKIRKMLCLISWIENISYFRALAYARNSSYKIYYFSAHHESPEIELGWHFKVHSHSSIFINELNSTKYTLQIKALLYNLLNIHHFSINLIGIWFLLILLTNYNNKIYCTKDWLTWSI